MKNTCPNCGEKIVVNATGRKPLNIAVINVCDALRLHRGVLPAAKKLGCSRAYVYQELGKHGLKPRDIINESSNIRQM